MSEKQVITMTQFKAVVEDFKSDLKKMSEVMQHNFTTINTKLDSHAEQIALLHENVTEIKHSLKLKVDREEFAKPDKRVTRLENKVA